MDVARMVIENPRNGTELRFDKDVTGQLADTYVWNDAPNDGGWDAIYAVQSVLPPPGFIGPAPAVGVQLLGPISNLPNLDLPSHLNLDDWPSSAITFYDGLLQDPFGTDIEAEIYSLTPNIAPLQPGDYDADGEVDVDDYFGWRYSYGNDRVLYADGNDDGIVDAADYVIWRKAFSDTISGSSVTEHTVPEPATIAMLIVGILALCSRRHAALP
jgi:hypothetical protein